MTDGYFFPYTFEIDAMKNLVTIVEFDAKLTVFEINTVGNIYLKFITDGLTVFKIDRLITLFEIDH